MRILSEREMLHQAIRADWWDIAPKLAYADWLDEQGGEKEVELAACIRNPLGPKSWCPKVNGTRPCVRWAGGLVWGLYCYESWFRNVGAAFLRLHPVLEVVLDDIIDFRYIAKSSIELKLESYAMRFQGVNFKQTLFRIHNDEQPIALKHFTPMGYEPPTA